MEGKNAKVWEKFYTEESLRQRYALMEHPKARAARPRLCAAPAVAPLRRTAPVAPPAVLAAPAARAR